MTEIPAAESARPARVVILVGTDADSLGKVAHELEAAGDHAAVFIDDMSSPEARAALREMIDELFAR